MKPWEVPRERQDGDGGWGEVDGEKKSARFIEVVLENTDSSATSVGMMQSLCRVERDPAT